MTEMTREQPHLGSSFQNFLEQYGKDKAEGTVRPLHEYLLRYPGSDDAIAAEYLHLQRGGATTAPDMGTRIGPYRIIRALGRGGQATVYLAEDSALDRQVALKVLEGIGPAHEEVLARFRREALATSALAHPGICAVYEARIDARIPYIAMQYISGDTLARKIVTTREQRSATPTTMAIDVTSHTHATEDDVTAFEPLDAKEITEAVRIIEKAARSLHAAHEAGVIHRDVKPGNIMIPPDGDPVILDFGLARQEESDLGTLTRTGDIFGTPAYMSPEQLLAHRIRLDARTDVYSLGVTLYECLALRRPFEAPTREALYHAIQSKDARNLRAVNPAVSSDLAVVVATAIEKDRDRRYQSALAFAEDLGRVLRREPILARPVGALGKLLRWARRNPSIAASVVAILLTLLTATVVSLAAWSAAERDALSRQEALNKFVQLADVVTLRRLPTWSNALWPAYPESIEGEEGMDAWLVAAEAIKSNLPGHEAALRALLTASASSAVTGAPTPDYDPTESDLIAYSTRVRIRDPLDSLRRDALVELVSSSATLTSGITDMRSRRQRADEAQQRVHSTGSWNSAIAAIAASPIYGGLRLREQRGLAPIGFDPQSRLWEFVDLQTGTVPVRDPSSGRLILDQHSGVVFILLPGGTIPEPTKERRFSSPEEKDFDRAFDDLGFFPRAPTGVVQPLLVSKYEMTESQWARVTGEFPNSITSTDGLAVTKGQSLHPVETISKSAADEVLGRLGFRLPTGPEWLYAALGGQNTSWWSGSDADVILKNDNVGDSSLLRALPALANPKGARALFGEADDGYAFHAPIGSFAANPFGLHDVHGNVSEWTSDSILNLMEQAESRMVVAHMFIEQVQRLIQRLYLPEWARTSTGAAFHHIGQLLAGARGGNFATPPILTHASVVVPYFQSLGIAFIGVRPVRDLE